MIGRDLCHLLMLKYEEYKFKKLGYHVIIIDNSPDFLWEHNYGIQMLGFHSRVAVLFAHTFEYTLNGHTIEAYFNSTSKVCVGKRLQDPTPRSFTGICIQNSHAFSYVKIKLRSKMPRLTEQYFETSNETKKSYPIR